MRILRSASQHPAGRLLVACLASALALGIIWTRPLPESHADVSVVVVDGVVGDETDLDPSAGRPPYAPAGRPPDSPPRRLQGRRSWRRPRRSPTARSSPQRTEPSAGTARRIAPSISPQAFRPPVRSNRAVDLDPGGVYHGAFLEHADRNEEQPDYLRSYPGEWPFDGGTRRASTLRVMGPDVIFRDFEVMKSDPDRVSDQPTNKPTDVSRAQWSGVWVEGLPTS